MSFAAGQAYLTSRGDDGPMPAAMAPVFDMNESFTITATCPNSYKAFINGEEITLPYTVNQTYQQQTIVVSVSPSFFRILFLLLWKNVWFLFFVTNFAHGKP